MTVLIAGSGRSGTSLATMVLAALGLDSGDHEKMVAATELNPRGFFELRPLMEFIPNRIAPLFPSGPFAKKHFTSGWERRSGVPELLADGRALWESLQTSDSMVFKFFDVGYHLPVWRQIINEEIVFVVVFRDPYEVVTSYQGVAKFFAREPESVAFRLFKWAALYQRLLREIEGSKAYFIEYGQLLTEPERVIGDLATALVDWGVLKAPVDTSAAMALVDPSLYRSGKIRPVPTARLRPRTRGMYTALRQLSGRHDNFHWSKPVRDGRDLYSIILVRGRQALRPLRKVVQSLRAGRTESSTPTDR